uniref:RCC1 domain containing 1 n=1 Tax=Oryzias melastigma TaxID=30732 RepID=A0A3B3BXZ2_ORYME
SIRADAMRWFGFGFNAFQQIQASKNSENSGLDADKTRLSSPTELRGHVNKDGGYFELTQIRASWSRRAFLHLDEILFKVFALFFLNFLAAVSLPLVPGGYIASKSPFFHSLSPHMQAKSLALGGDHVILLTAAGAVYTWGQGSHGQLGHGALLSEEEPRTVEALWGMKMSSVSAGGWHSVCISDAGDLYVWGWNESGQLGLPSQNLRKISERKAHQQGELSQNSSTYQEEVFISIQAFPALLDVTPLCEVKAVGCGSRHTAAVTTSGDLYTWGWGGYGQLGHQSFSSLDEPQRVEFFRVQQLRVVGVECGPWNTFAAVTKEEGLAPEHPTKPLNKHGE